jgi:transcriptional regulator with GAF, ATPase, and Fis domain
MTIPRLALRNIPPLSNLPRAQLVTPPRAAHQPPELSRVHLRLTDSPAAPPDLVDPPFSYGTRKYFTEAEWQELERENLLSALAQAGGKVSGPAGAAERLGVNPNTLASRLRALGISRKHTSET